MSKRRKKRRKPKASDRVSNVSECAEAIGINDETLRDYVQRGCPHDKGGVGKSNLFDPTEVAAWMKANNLTGKPGRPVEAGSDQLESVRVRKETAMAVNWEFRNSTLEGELVNKAEYRRHWIAEVQTIKNKCRGLAAAVAPACVGLDAGEIQGLIEDRMGQIFRELSE